MRCHLITSGLEWRPLGVRIDAKARNRSTAALLPKPALVGEVSPEIASRGGAVLRVQCEVAGVLARRRSSGSVVHSQEGLEVRVAGITSGAAIGSEGAAAGTISVNVVAERADHEDIDSSSGRGTFREYSTLVPFDNMAAVVRRGIVSL
jgi:hypothetical protein